MTKEEIIRLINKGENQQVEFKKAKDTLPNSIWETYSAFANTDGGIILLGVAEYSGRYLVDGVNSPDKLINEFWNQANNHQKVSVNILFDIHIKPLLLDDKTLIAIEIPRANRQERPIYINNNVLTGSYRRNFEGDYRCSEAEVKAMLRDQAEVSVDLSVFPDIDYVELLSDTFRRYRIRFKNLKPAHIWNNLSDEEFLLKIGAVRRVGNFLQPTLAGILMFCEEATIAGLLPHYFLDFRVKESNDGLRWSDRVFSNSGDWSGNVFDFYFKVTDRVLNTIKAPFRLQNATRIDDTPIHEGLREAVANTLIHADYYGSRGVVIELFPQRIVFQNPGSLRISLAAATEGGISDPRNSALFKMFALVGIGERAGSGLHAIHFIWNTLGFPKPDLSESFNPERISFVLQWHHSGQGSEKTAGSSEEIKKSSEKTAGSSEEIKKSSEKTGDKIVRQIKDNPYITIAELARLIGISTRAIEKQLEKLKIAQQIQRKGPDKGGYWEVME